MEQDRAGKNEIAARQPHQPEQKSKGYNGEIYGRNSRPGRGNRLRRLKHKLHDESKLADRERQLEVSEEVE